MDYFVNGQIDIGGRATDALAKKYSQEHGCDYTTALRSVVRQQSTQQRKYAAENPEGQAIQLLGGMVASLPKQDSGLVDMNLALETINNSETFRDLAQRAAGQHLNNLAQRLLGMSKPHEGVTFEDALRIVSRDNPEISKMYAGGRATEAGLKAILWTIFRYQQSQRTMVKTYSSDSHISFDASGNEIRTYSLDVVRR